MSRPSLHSSYHHSAIPNPALASRIASKRAELENLKSLRDLSANLATQMSALAQKLSTLRDGTEAVACVLANWENVLGVIGMVGASAAGLVDSQGDEDGNHGDVEREEEKNNEVKLPETLVRIPVKSVKEEKSEIGE